MKSTPKRKVVKTDPSDLQAPIEPSPETAMQVKEPLITQDIEVVQETAPKPDPNFIPRIPCDDPPRINPNGDPFDTMYRRQQKQ